MSEPTGSLSHYRLVERVEGGGEIWRAVDTRDDREVVLGLLSPTFAADPGRLERFKEEAKALASLDHPNIVAIRAVDVFEGTHFYIRDLVQGSCLSEQIPPDGLPRRRFFELAFALVDAVRAAHWLGVTHRDLKSSHVMVADDGKIRVLGFGLAEARAALSPTAKDPEVDTDDTPTLTLTQGSPARAAVPYMSPEQVQGKPLDHRADVFSLGSMLYEMATGHRAFDGESPADVVVAVLRDDPAPITELNAMLPESLERLLQNALIKDRHDRLKSVQVLYDELTRIRDETEPDVDR